ncbi:MAG TPA: D-alanine--D-alanine ligase family protein [Terriglobia bacterium]|nr:D-alanine--D-alanine ligase family protein [Terriglobia bacterium]
MKKLRVAVVFGGRSGEHEVSLRSAEFIIASLDPQRYDVVPIGITPEGRWLSGRAMLASAPPRERIQGALTHGEPVTLAPEPIEPRPFDVVFPILHGTYGEDGTVQGLLELADLPYVGAGVLGSAAGMDKDVMKRLLRDAGLPIVDFWAPGAAEIESFIARERDRLPYPVFVKPANLGSSVGISKVHDAGELPAALALAAEFDRKIVVERGVNAREIEVAVLGNDSPMASVPGEIVPSREFYDYTAKYVDDDSRLLIPAPLEPKQVEDARNVALHVFKVLECSGLARIDLFLDRSSGKFYVNEINTLPGFTAISMYPKLWEASGVPHKQLIDRLITLAIERHSEKKRLRTRY